MVQPVQRSQSTRQMAPTSGCSGPGSFTMQSTGQTTMHASQPVQPFSSMSALGRGFLGFFATAGLGGAVASAPAEYLNYHLYRAILRWETLDRVMRSRSTLAVVSLFERRPFLAIVACAASPLPDWAARALAAHAGYSVPRYLGAFVIGRLPKFWLIAAAGSYWMPGTVTILAIAGGAAAISIVGVLRRCLGPGTTPSSLRPLSSARG